MKIIKVPYSQLFLFVVLELIRYHFLLIDPMGGGGGGGVNALTVGIRQL